MQQLQQSRNLPSARRSTEDICERELAGGDCRWIVVHGICCSVILVYELIVQVALSEQD